MTPHMSDDERRLFRSILMCSRRYLEFGCGGSTHMAASLVKEWVISVDASAEWIEKVRQASVVETGGVRPTLVHVDIGPTAEWGYPSNEDDRARWPDYHRN